MLGLPSFAVLISGIQYTGIAIPPGLVRRRRSAALVAALSIHDDPVSSSYRCIPHNNESPHPYNAWQVQLLGTQPRCALRSR